MGNTGLWSHAKVTQVTQTFAWNITQNLTTQNTTKCRKIPQNNAKMQCRFRYVAMSFGVWANVIICIVQCRFAS